MNVQSGDRDDNHTHRGGAPTPPPELEAADRGKRFLCMVDGIHLGRRIVFQGMPVTIGRADPCDVVIPDSEISRAHCRVEQFGDEVIVTDLGSTNGTYVDGRQVSGAAKLPEGGMLRIGRQLLRHEVRSSREIAAAEWLDSDLASASSYVASLLPARLTSGQVRTDWVFEPSAHLGGDALGYHAIDERHFALYLIDVAGHGAMAALHAASVINVLRKQALPDVDVRQPAQVMRALNAMFPMEEHRDLFFTAWYGVYLRDERLLRYCCGGHHPGYLIGADRRGATALWTRNPVVGAKRGHDFTAATAAVAPKSTLYLFSDGLFEFKSADGAPRGLDEFLWLLLAQSAAGSNPERVVREVKRVTGRKVFDDDVTLLVAGFS